MFQCQQEYECSNVSNSLNVAILSRFETAWNLGEDSPWCAVFKAEDLAVFEFREDLKYFYK